MTVDQLTKRWIRNAADERAASRGCRFDEERGQFVVDWIQTYCRLYEGERAGEPMILGDWQYDVTMRLFGWVRHSERWGREVRRFRQASIWVPKKNGKSPTLAAWGLYLLCGDGEQGQKVFLAAKDGKQAKEIAGKHAMEMLAQSEELTRECSINANSARITHEPTRSLLQPLSSSNARTKESKEGLNGSVLIDEVHVVDRDFVSRIDRAGISRSEPLHIEVSTAGNNPDGYGYERFQYAQGVESGAIEDDEICTAIYAAPQNLTDEELAADPLKYGRLANPTMGRIVDETEFLNDYRRSVSSIDRLAQCKMYRLNIWQRAANPWLSQETWQNCRALYDESGLEGLPCWGGLDLSLTRDMTAFVLAFRDDDWLRLLPFFWLPESHAERNADKAPYRQWAAEGWLRLIPGDTIDHNFLRPELVEIIERFQPRQIAYDKTFAIQLMTDLDSHPDLTFEAVEFPQTPLKLTAPCGDFERMLLEGEIQHNGHPVMTWQAGHVCLDRNEKTKLCRPAKPKTGGDHLTIDGIVAAVMAVERANADEESVYNSGESLEL